MKQRLVKLERLVGSLGAARCRHCGGSSGVGGVPAVRVLGGKTDDSTYDANRRCWRCGREAPYEVNIVTPLMNGTEGMIYE